MFSFLVAAVYLVVIGAYNVKVKEQPIGLPNPEFWSSLSSLVVDGVGFVKQQAVGGEGANGAVKPAKSAVDKIDDLSSPLLVSDDPDYVADDADYDADDAEQGKKKKKKKPKKTVRRGSDSHVDVAVVAKKPPKKKKPKGRKSMPELVPEDDDGAGLE